jgi:hypothetical protein
MPKYGSSAASMIQIVIESKKIPFSSELCSECECDPMTILPDLSGLILEDEGRDNLYQILLQELVEEAYQQEDIVGILLTGSVARGDALPGADLDVRYLLPEGKSRPFQSELHHGIVVERSYADLPRAQSNLEANPMEVYAYLDGRILLAGQGYASAYRGTTGSQTAHPQTEALRCLPAQRTPGRSCPLAIRLSRPAPLPISTTRSPGQSWPMRKGLPVPANDAIESSGRPSNQSSW